MENPVIDIGRRFGKTENCVLTNWQSTFSDGTPVGIKTTTYGLDPVYNRVVDDHLNLLFIK